MKDRIKAARIAAGLSQGQLARVLDCSRSLVTQWESGATAADGWVERIADVLQVGPAWLRTGEAESAACVAQMPGAERIAPEGLARVQALADMVARVPHA